MEIQFTKDTEDKAVWQKRYGELLKWVLEMYNVDCDELAEKINISASAIRQWENGRNFPSKTLLENLYTFLIQVVNQPEQERLSNHLIKQIIKFVPEAKELIDRKNGDVGKILVDTLRMCYAYGKTEKNVQCLYNDNVVYESTGRTQAVVFDFDGTLTDGTAVKTTWESIWTAIGYDVEECRTLHRRFDNGEITHVEWCRLTREKFCAQKLHKRIVDEIAEKIYLLAGCEEVFQHFKDHNIKLYIVSGSILCVIQNVLKGLTMYVDAIKANDFKFSSDGYLEEIIGTKYDFAGKADFVREVAANLKISEKDILFIGNSYNDKFVSETNAKTLCINPKNTDPSDRAIWNECIQECTDLRKILRFVQF